MTSIEEDSFVNIAQEEKPMTTSQESGSSDGILLLTSGPSSSCSGRGGTESSSDLEDVGEHDLDQGEEGEEAVDGLVLMGSSTRLRPAAAECGGGIGKAKLYASTYHQLFNSRQDCTSAILPLALQGNLRSSPFRSLCWRVLLNVLPSNSSGWLKALAALRSNYSELQQRLSVQERLKDSRLDPVINNPLSQDEESPWNQHFRDDELRKLIWQDVARTFPEVDYFQSAAVREIMVNVLFVYARSHPDISYRQGMHELLAPLVFVMDNDHQAFYSAKENGKEELDGVVPEELFSHEWVEHDIYALFETLMEAVGPWYVTGKPVDVAVKGCDSNGTPWSRPQDGASGNKVVENLNYIQDVLLRRHDPTLCARLEKLEIFPQIYGIRWLRLLFGREFNLADTLELWDALLADSCPPSLADQLVISLLMSVRELLLKYDYPDAVQLLMKLPSNLSVRHIVSFALHLKDPLRFPKPTGSPFHHGERRMPSGQTTSRFKKVATPSLLRQKPDPGTNKNLKMGKMNPAAGSTSKSVIMAGRKKEPAEKDKSKSSPLKGASTIGFRNGSRVQDTPDFTVLDVKQEEFEQVGDEVKEIEGDPLTMALDRRKHRSSGQEDGVRGKLIVAVSSLTRLLGGEQLKQKEEVFLHLRHISDLCNSLPLEAESGQSLELKCSPGSHLNTSGKISQNQKPTFGEPLNCDLKSKDNDNQQKRSSGVYDFTPTNKQSSKEGLGREPSLACEVSSYFQEQ